MRNIINNVAVASLIAISMLSVSCKDTDVYDSGRNILPEKEANTFNFSTIQDVNLTVDYSSFNTYGPVFFSVYNENPFVGEGEDEHLDETIAPIFEDYTDANGKYSMKVQLPAYAENLYVVTGNSFVSDRLIETKVQDGAIKAVATNTAKARTRAGESAGSGVQTNNLSTLAHLSYIVDENGVATNERIYKDWLTPLGTWDSKSGAPSYLLKPGDVRSELLCSEEEINGLFSAIGEALDVNKPCNEEYLNQADLTLEKASEVTITVLGGSTCWNSTLGYYYYTSDNEPTSPEDLNIIMLFPNTQDGEWARMKSNMSYNGNIGIHRGDAVQLMYYPNIANGGDLSGATKIFPVGTKIGFILKANGWAMQGKDYAIKNLNDATRKYNVWGASTNGTSFCRAFGKEGVSPYQYCNPNGLSRSARFAYNAPNGDKYAIVSFEDACNDQDYDDLIFALKPVNAFTPLPEIKEKKTTTVGVYAFEDLWPSKGDYDMNDVMVELKHEKAMSKKGNEDFKIYQESFYFTTYQNFVTLTSGLAVKLDTPVKPSSIEMKKIASGSEEEVEAQFIVDGDIIYLTDDVTGNLGTTYILRLNYSVGQTSSDLAKVYPFIYRNEVMNMMWEMHLPFEAPTSRMNFSLFGKDDDASVPSKDLYYVRQGNYPFAFYLFGVNIDSFKETLLKRANESKPINELYPDFLMWSTTKGAACRDWYLQK